MSSRGQRINVDPKRTVQPARIAAIPERRGQPDDLRRLRLGMRVGDQQPRIGQPTRLHQQLRPRQSEHVMVRVAARRSVGDVAGRALIAKIARDPDCNIGRSAAPTRPPKSRAYDNYRPSPARAPRVRRWGRSSHEDRAGDRVLALRRRLRASEHLDPVEVPRGRDAEHELVVGLPPSVDDQCGSRPVAAEERRQRLQRAGRVLPTDRRALAAAAQLNVGNEL